MTDPGPSNDAIWDITVEMLLRAAEAIASTVTADEVNPNFIIPTVFNTEVPKAVARAIRGVESD